MMPAKPDRKREMSILGGTFFCVFLSFTMMQGYAVQLYGPALAADTEAALYASFTACCLAAPAAVDALGSRCGLFVGALSYAALALASFAYAAKDASPGLRPLVVASGAVVGVGASIIWTAHARIMLQYGGGDGGQAGAAFGVFWAFFNSSALVGGVLTWAYFSRVRLTPTSEAPLFCVFAVLIAVGAAGAFMLERLPADAIVARQRPRCVPPCAHTWPIPVELLSTLGVLRSARLAAAAPLWFVTGLASAFQLATFADRSLAPSPLGLGLALFYGAEVVGGALAATLLSARAGRLRLLWLALALVTVGCALALALELSAVGQVERLADWRHSLPVLVALGSWGTADALSQAFAYAEIALLATAASSPAAQTHAVRHPLLGEPADEAVLDGSAPLVAAAAHGDPGRAVVATADAHASQLPEAYVSAHARTAALGRSAACFKLIQSLGWCVGFALSPPERVSPRAQLLSVWVMYSSALLLAACVQPAYSDVQHVDDEEIVTGHAVFVIEPAAPGPGPAAPSPTGTIIA